MGKKPRKLPEVNASSMADIAFLLLIFFLVTTTIASDKGLMVQLPPKRDAQDKTDDVKVKERNVFSVIMNSQDMLLVEGEPSSADVIKDKVKEFITNEGKNPNSSEDPQKAVVSIKTDRGTSYELYIKVYDEVKKAYSEVRAAYLNVKIERYMEIAEKKTPEDQELFDKAQEKYPYQVSDAEPTSVGK